MNALHLIDVKQLSELLNVKPKTLYQWAELGQIPCLKLNGSLRFDPEDIKAWIDNCKRRSESGYNSFVQTRSPGKESVS